MSNTPITSATITIHNASTDALVATATPSNLQFVVNGLTAGEYYYKIVSTGRGTVIDDLNIIEGETPNPIDKTVIMYPGIDSVPVTLKDKDGAYISDATVKIAKIPGVYDGTGNKYDIEDVPTGTRTLHVSHTNSAYQSIDKDVTIESGVSFDNEILYPVIDIRIKVYGIKQDGTREDLTNRTNCIVYNPTTYNNVIDDTTKLDKSDNYAIILNANNGNYRLVVPAFSTVIDGTTYDIDTIDQIHYLEYNGSDNGDRFVELNTNL